MSDKSFTFFEFHFHEGVQVGPRQLGGFGGEEADEEQPATPEPSAPQNEDGGCLGCKLVGLGVFAAAAYALRKLLGAESNGLDALDDIETADEANGEEDGDVAIEVQSGEEREGGNAGLVVVAVVALLVLLALAARKLLGDGIEDIEVPDELAGT
jgi:hypothetical protein